VAISTVERFKIDHVAGEFPAIDRKEKAADFRGHFC